GQAAALITSLTHSPALAEYQVAAPFLLRAPTSLPHLLRPTTAAVTIARSLLPCNGHLRYRSKPPSPLQIVSYPSSVTQPLFRHVDAVPLHSSPSLFLFFHTPSSSTPFSPCSTLLCSNSAAHHPPWLQCRGGLGHLFS
ncbi:hypothetical protein S83_038839, partial [Arachis hypogaea]